MTESDDIEAFGDQIDALQESLAGAQGMTAAFSGELSEMRGTMADTNRQVAGVSTGISRGLRGALDGLVFDGMKASDALRQVGKSLLSASFTAAVNPLSKQLGQLVGGGLESVLTGAMPFAKGGSFAQGRVMPFARGGVVTGPTTFPMRGGTGLMGEAGPEAIMPLTRGPDGSLGVRSDGGGGRAVQVNVNISTPDVEGFRRSQGQIAAQMGRALAQGQRNR